jgi:hypothetical protein
MPLLQCALVDPKTKAVTASTQQFSHLDSTPEQCVPLNAISAQKGKASQYLERVLEVDIEASTVWTVVNTTATRYQARCRRIANL